jgi:cytochrome P450
MTREEMLDNIGTIFFGAYDTTSATLAFTMHFLAQQQAAQDTLATELKGVDLATIPREALEKLPYLDMVCREANRLSPTATAFPRTALEDIELGGFSIKKGTTCILDHVTLPGKDPEHWGGQTDLADFRPERWGEVKPNRLASLPFGFGGRICPGAQLATLEHKFITAYFVQKFSWRVDATRPMTTTMKVGLCPANGCWLVPEVRSEVGI